MHRPTITAFAIVAVLAGMAVQAHAKPSVAVLGLEVITDAKGSLDAQATEVAKELTDALRARARDREAENKYTLAPNSDKDLLEMKLLSGCSSEGRRCMAAIGKELKADYLLYGKLEKSKSQGVYKVTLKLLRVERSTDIKTLPTAKIPFDQASGAGLENWARRMYNEITGVPNDGTLVVSVDNAKVGKVFVDGKPVAGLSDGTATVRGVAEGNHEVRVEADGFERYEAEVSVIAGRKAEVEIALMPEGAMDASGGGTDKPSRGGGGYRAMFYVSAAVFVGGAGGLVYSGGQVSKANDEVDKFIAKGGNPPQIPIDGDVLAALQAEIGNKGDLANDACAITEANRPGDANAARLFDACSDGNKFATLSLVSGVVMGVGGALAAFTFYKGFISPSGGERATARAGRKSVSDSITITPIVSPHYAGGTVKIEF